MRELYDDAISEETFKEWTRWLGTLGRDMSSEEYRRRAWACLRYMERERRRLRTQDPQTLTFAAHRWLRAHAKWRALLTLYVGWGWLEGLD